MTGVAEDIAMTGLSAATRLLQVCRPLPRKLRSNTLALRLEDGRDPAALLPLVRSTTLDVDGDLRIDGLSVASELLQDSLARERFTSTIMSLLAGMALLLAAVRQYSVVSQVVGQRAREIGIRMALGANHRGIRWMVLRKAGGAAAAGIVAGFGLAFWGSSLIESQVFGLEGHSRGAYALSAIALMATSLSRLRARAPRQRHRSGRRYAS